MGRSGRSPRTPSTNSVYVGGEFTTVNGIARVAVVKLDATTGTVDPVFAPSIRSGRITDLKLVTIGGITHLIVAGNMGKLLFSLDPATGKDDGYLKTASLTLFRAPGAGSRSTTSRSIPTGDASRCDRQFPDRRRKWLGRDSSCLTCRPAAPPFHLVLPGFAKPCTSTVARRIAYLQGVDWSPSGDSFDVTATGQIPLNKSDVWYQRLGTGNVPDTTVCDGVGRFSLTTTPSLNGSTTPVVTAFGSWSIPEPPSTSKAISSGWTTLTATRARG